MPLIFKSGDLELQQNRPALDIFKDSSKVAYYTGEENVRSKWPKEFLKARE